MKVLVYFSFVMLLILLFVRCRSSEEIVKFKPYKAKDYITKEIKVYEVKECLYPILDSIITKTEGCPMYQGLKNKIAFSFDILSDSTEFSIGVEYLPRFKNHARYTDAIFYYKGYDFYCGETFLDYFFKKTDRTIFINCIDSKKFQFEMHFRGDMDMFWWYNYINGQIINTTYGYCSEEPGGLILWL